MLRQTPYLLFATARAGAGAWRAGAIAGVNPSGGDSGGTALMPFPALAAIRLFCLPTLHTGSCWRAPSVRERALPAVFCAINSSAAQRRGSLQISSACWRNGFFSTMVWAAAGHSRTRGILSSVLQATAHVSLRLTLLFSATFLHFSLALNVSDAVCRYVAHAADTVYERRTAYSLSGTGTGEDVLFFRSSPRDMTVFSALAVLRCCSSSLSTHFCGLVVNVNAGFGR
jgi:hypothetical protein